MNRTIVAAALVVLGGTFTIGVGCGGSTSNNSLGDGANAAGGTAGTSAAGGGTVSAGGTQSAAGTSAAGGAVSTGGQASAAGGAVASGGKAGGTSAAGGNTSAAGGNTSAAGGKAQGGNGTAGNTTGNGGNGTAGTTTSNGGVSAAGGNVDTPDASNPFDVDIPDVSFGMDATAAGCYGCIASSCPTQIATCQQDAKCTTAVQCVIDTCQGATDFMCVLGCGQTAGIMSQMDPAAQALIGVVTCSGQACAADCGGGMMGNPIGGGQGMGGNTGMGTGGNGTGGTSTCNMQGCFGSCGKDLAPCQKDAVCKACIQHPTDQGCSSNAAFTAIQTCCSANTTCTGCGFCP